MNLKPIHPQQPLPQKCIASYTLINLTTFDTSNKRPSKNPDKMSTNTSPFHSTISAPTPHVQQHSNQEIKKPQICSIPKFSNLRPLHSTHYILDHKTTKRRNSLIPPSPLFTRKLPYRNRTSHCRPPGIVYRPSSPLCPCRPNGP